MREKGARNLVARDSTPRIPEGTFEGLRGTAEKGKEQRLSAKAQKRKKGCIAGALPSPRYLLSQGRA